VALLVLKSSISLQLIIHFFLSNKSSISDFLYFYINRLLACIEWSYWTLFAFFNCPYSRNCAFSVI